MIKAILKELKKQGSKRNIEGMARFGIDSSKAYGVPMPILRKKAKELGKNHALAGQLWKQEVHEAKILACLVDEPEKVTEKQMDAWIKKFYSWDQCDECCMNLFDKTPYAYAKAVEWSSRKKEFEKRAGFALMAVLAYHDKKADDKKFLRFLPLITHEAIDERNFVKKAVNWALRQIGKRSKMLNKEAIKTAEKIAKLDSKSARWIAKDALRELKSDAVRKRLR